MVDVGDAAGMNRIGVTWSGMVAVLSLDRPSARNALAIADWHALAQAASQLGDARAVVLRSSVPGIFSAGADIGEFDALQTDAEQRPRFREALRIGIEAVAALPMPVIAAIDGGCFGAAVALALAADIRIAGDGAAFAVTPARLGLGYPQADVRRLVAQVGRGAAAELLFSGDRIDADAAFRIGLVERRASEAAAAALDLAVRIADNAPQAVRLLKRSLTGTEGGLDTAFDDAFGGIELAEGLRAFQERRKAVF